MNQADIYGLLSSMYLCKPTREILITWSELLEGCDEPALQCLRTALAGFDFNDEQQLEDVLWEYTRLFIGPYKLPCPPLESVYTSQKRLMMQEAHDQVRDFYLKAGFEVASDDVMLDHIGVELNFIAVLLGKSSEVEASENQYSSLARQFAAEHLIPWVPQFAKDMEQSSELPLYKSLAQITVNTIVNISPG